MASVNLIPLEYDSLSGTIGATDVKHAVKGQFLRTHGSAEQGFRLDQPNLHYFVSLLAGPLDPG